MHEPRSKNAEAFLNHRFVYHNSKKNKKQLIFQD